ncbi:hypothetical protein ACLMJK_006791 [Lecanora helva]
MFCTTLRQRPDLPSIVPILATSPLFKLRETTLETHDLALPVRSPPSNSILQRQQQQPLPNQPFLLLTPSSLSNPNLSERITRFSTLTSTPTPTIAFALKSESHTSNDSASGMHAFMQLQTLLYALPTAPPPLLPIPTLTDLLPLLKPRTTSSPPNPLPPPPISPLVLLPHLTSTAPGRPLPEHTMNVLSDLCHSIRDVLELVGTEEGKVTLEEWVGAEEARGLVEFWEGEWIVE